ncbi:unnamed protein product [Hydatigera taeniaeformis]|uniref:40S ribosomal protein S19-binding protein 1 n=1 Tax=Hydatigena taeniaeformis TaxID=6205 RepID=A0A0R3XAN2_HYDTA|nr:unnamed protein product [Hydatigera taeniaeformis]
MSLKNALREVSLSLVEEEINSEKAKDSEKGILRFRKTLQGSGDVRKYGQVKFQRNQRRKRISKNRSWKQFASSTGLRAPPRKKSKDAIMGTVRPREDLVNLGKSILRSRRKLLDPGPPPQVKRKRKSLFQEKDFRKLGQDLRTLFCS